MLDEVLFMQMRLFRMFCEQQHLAAVQGNKVFQKYKIWDYIADSYDVLHTNGDDCALSDIANIVSRGDCVV